MDNQNVNNCIDIKIITESLFMLSHLIFAIIIIICLRKYRPIITFLMLSMILSYICYSERHSIPPHVIPLIASFIFLINITLKKIEENETGKRFCWMEFLKNEMWKLPFWGILVHYGIMTANYMVPK